MSCTMCWIALVIVVCTIIAGAFAALVSRINGPDDGDEHEADAPPRDWRDAP